MGSLLEFTAGDGTVLRRVYLSGDTLVFEGLQAIREHVGEVDRAVLHLGGTTLPGGLVVTMDGRQGMEALRTIAPRRATPVHFDDWKVTIRLLGVGAVAGPDPEARAYEFRVTGAAPPPRE